MDWEKDDDPWVEHARWSPDCSFVILNKGKQFVKEFSHEVRDDPTRNQIVSIPFNHFENMCITESLYYSYFQELCKLITVHKNVSVIERKPKTTIAKRFVIFCIFN